LAFFTKKKSGKPSKKNLASLPRKIWQVFAVFELKVTSRQNSKCWDFVANRGGRVRNGAGAGAGAGAGTLPKLLAQRHDKKSYGGTSALETTNSSIEKIDTSYSDYFVQSTLRQLQIPLEIQLSGCVGAVRCLCDGVLGAKGKKIG
jgi:hypothetical protein